MALQKVDFDPFAQSGGSRLQKVDFNPFARSSPSLPRGKFGSGIEMAALAADPSLQVTGRARTPERNRQVGGVANSAHLTDNARDFVPRKGESLSQAEARLNKEFRGKGYKVLVEGAGAAHSTAPHLHVEATGESQPLLEKVDFDPFKSPPAPKLEKVAHNPFAAPKSVPRPENRPRRRASAPPQDPGLLGAVGKGAANIPHQLYKMGAGAVEAVKHPITTAKRAGRTALDTVTHPGRTFHNFVEGVGEQAVGGVSALADEVGLGKYLPGVEKQAEHKFKQGIIENPVGTIASFAPFGGAAGRLVGKLGVKGYDTAKGISAAERASIRAKRAEAASHAKSYKDVAKATLAQHDLEARRATAKLNKHMKDVGNLPEKEQRKLAIAADTGNRKGIDPKHFPALDAMREVGETYKARIKQIYKAAGKTVPEFVDNYYKHLWEQGKAAGKGGKQGSSASLQGRKFEEFTQGLEAGLKPQNENPLHVMSIYSHQISNHLGALDLQNKMKSRGLAKWVSDKAIPEGMTKLDGINTDRLFTDKEGKPRRLVLAAKDPAAKLYNRRLAPSMLNNPVGRGIQKAAGAATAVKLIGAFHPALIAGKSVASDFGNGLRYLTQGKLGKAAKSIAHMPFAPALTFKEGLKMRDRLLTGEQAMKRIDKLYVKAGGRTAEGGMAPYEATSAPSYLESARQGTGVTDFKHQFDDAMKGPALKRLFVGAPKGLAQTFTRALKSETDAVFKHYVPAIKMGAFEREMKASLEAHPEWTDAQQIEEARAVHSNIEGRMGLVTKDNLFWNNTLSDIARLVLLSPSWQIGNARLLEQTLKGIPESVRDLRRGKGLTHAPAQAIGLLGSHMIGNALLQAVYTKKPPQDMQDLLEARTGGTNKDGSPERVMAPTVMREMYEWLTNPQQEAPNVIHPALKSTWQLGTNEDWKRDRIYRPSNVDPVSPADSRGGQIADYLEEQALPISFNSDNNPDSHVGRLSRLAGIQPLGQRWTNPERYDAGERARWQKDFKKQQRAKAKKKQ